MSKYSGFQSVAKHYFDEKRFGRTLCDDSFESPGGP